MNEKIQIEQLNTPNLIGFIKFVLMCRYGYETTNKIIATLFEINKMNSQMASLICKNILNPNILKGHVGEVLMAGTFNINAAKLGNTIRIELTAFNGLPTHSADFIFTKQYAKFPSTLEGYPKIKMGQLKIGPTASKSLMCSKNIKKYQGMNLYSSSVTKISKNRICMNGIKSIKANNKNFIKISKSLLKNGHYKLLSTNKEIYKIIFKKANIVLFTACAIHALYTNCKLWKNGKQNVYMTIINSILDTYGIRDLYSAYKLCNREISYIANLNNKLLLPNDLLQSTCLKNIAFLLCITISSSSVLPYIREIHCYKLYLQHIKEQQCLTDKFIDALKNNFSGEDYRYVSSALESYKQKKWYSEDEIPIQINKIKELIDEHKLCDYEIQFQLEIEKLNELACDETSSEYINYVTELKERACNGDEIAISLLDIEDIEIDSNIDNIKIDRNVMQKIKNAGKYAGKHCKNAFIGYAGKLGERYHKTGKLIKKDDIQAITINITQNIATEKIGEYMIKKYSSSFVNKMREFINSPSVEKATKLFGDDFIQKTASEQQILINKKSIKANEVSKKAALRGKVAGSVCAGIIGFGTDIGIKIWNKGIRNLDKNDFKAAFATGCKTGSTSFLFSILMNSKDGMKKAGAKAGAIGATLSIVEEGYNVYKTKHLKDHDLGKTTIKTAFGSVVKMGSSSAVGYGLAALGGPIGILLAVGGSFATNYALSMADEKMSNLYGQRRTYFLHCCKKLELDENLDQHTFDRAVRKIKFKFHPDKVQNKDDEKKLTEQFQKISKYISFYSIYRGWDSMKILEDENEQKKSYSTKIYCALVDAYCKICEICNIGKQYEYYKEKDYYIYSIEIRDIDAKLEDNETNAVLGNKLLESIKKQIVITGCTLKDYAVSSFSGNINNIEYSKSEYNKPIRTIVATCDMVGLDVCTMIYVNLIDNIYLIGLNDDTYQSYMANAKKDV